MKKISNLLLIAIVVMIAACNQPVKKTGNASIKITLTGANGDSIFLAQRVGGEVVTFDSAVFTDDNTEIVASVELPELFYLRFNNTRGNIPVFVEKGEMTIAGDYNDLENLTITGSVAQEDLEAFNAETMAMDMQMNMIGQQYGQARQVGDTEKMDSLEAEYIELDNLKSAFITQYAFNNPEKVVAAFMILSNSYQYELDMLDSLTSSFSPAIGQSEYVKKLQDHVATLKSVAIGQPFVDFTLNTPEGVAMPLSSVIGKNYVLVDFWAAWCSPCRAENPNVVAAYNKYHDKGFDVFGVSFDKDKASWEKAIADDQLTWPQVSDLQYWNSEAGKLYGIQSIPQNILISPEGIIIDKNLRGEALHLKLQELLD
jgi:peroxiredoxin